MDFLFGEQNSVELKEYERIIDEIEKYGYNGRKNASSNVKYSDAIDENTNLSYETEQLKKYVNKDASRLDDILPKAFAIISEAARRHGKRPYPVQLMGAIALHRGNIAEMKTGEGKTITAVVASYLNALTGKGVHITTSNSYLAEEAGYKKMGPILEEAGLSVGVVTSGRDNNDPIDLQKRKEAYLKDVTYGSSDVFAFDYLYDNIAKDASKTVLRKEKVGFVIIDEADQILVNNAMTPFRLAGNMQMHTATSKEEIQKAKEEMIMWNFEKNTNYELADNIVYNLFQDKSHILNLDTKEQMDINLVGNKKASEFNQRRYSVIYSKANGVQLTERGQLQVFYMLNTEKILGLVNREDIKRDILSSNLFMEGLNEDYVISNNGSITLTLRGVERAVRNIKEIHNLNENYYAKNQEKGFDHYLNNALRAYFVQSIKEDYTLQDFVDAEGKIKKKVSLISDGRTAEGRVYSNGLQQAIELKEKRFNPNFSIEMTKEHDELASISQRAFYATYNKIGGMTGTSAKDIFEDVYGIDTVKIPKDSEYDLDKEEQERLESTRINKPDIVFATEKEKLEAVINSVIESQNMGQPVLIGTYSDEESLKLYRALQNAGIKCQFLNTENSSREAEIISRAGEKGAVTISTQMAGRGTDIMLGGDPDNIVLDLMAKKANEMIDIKFKGRTMSSEVREKYFNDAYRYVLNHKEEFLQKEGLTKEVIQKIASDKKMELVRIGGLKVIGYGHYDTKRGDEQLKGRAARQKDPGVTEFYSSIKEDLEQKLNIPTYLTDKIRKLGLEIGKPVMGEEISKIIERGQSIIEGNYANNLSNTQEQDQMISKLRGKVYSQRKRILFGDKENVQDHMEYIIESSIGNLIDEAIRGDNYNINPKKKINKVDFNKDKFINDTMATFGIDLSGKFVHEDFTTLGDIRDYVTKEAKKNYLLLREKNGNKLQDEIDRKKILATIDNAWLNFQEGLEGVNEAKNLYALAQNQSFNETIAVKKEYNRAMRSSKLEMLSATFGKQQVKNSSFQNIAKEERANEGFGNEYNVYDSKTKNNAITRFHIRTSKVITAFSNKIKLVKAKIKLQTKLNNYDMESNTIEEVDFSNSHTRR